VLHCTARLRRDPTLGLGWTPCEKCKAPSLAEAARKEFDANAVAVKAWLAEQDKIAKELSAEFEDGGDEHFVLTWGCGSFTADDRRMYDQHTGMHLFASRLETFYHDFYSNLQVGDEMLRNSKHHVFVLKDKKTIIKASQLYSA
jgi:hypothetical protein